MGMDLAQLLSYRPGCNKYSGSDAHALIPRAFILRPSRLKRLAARKFLLAALEVYFTAADLFFLAADLFFLAADLVLLTRLLDLATGLPLLDLKARLLDLGVDRGLGIGLPARVCPVAQVLLPCLARDLAGVAVDVVPAKTDNVPLGEIERRCSQDENILLQCEFSLAQPEDVRGDVSLKLCKRRATIRLFRPSTFHDVPDRVGEANVGKCGRPRRPLARQYLDQNGVVRPNVWERGLTGKQLLVRKVLVHGADESFPGAPPRAS
jgi:hypothetical protein